MEPQQDYLDGSEALAWLRSSTHPYPLGARFDGAEDAIRFVEWLYALGAERVVVPEFQIRSDPGTPHRKGGPWSSAIVVHLPAEPARREPLIWLCALEMREQQVSSPRDLEQYVGSRRVFLRWK